MKAKEKVTPKAVKPKTALKHGDYILFTITGRRHKGRVAIENDIFYLCQDVNAGGTINEQFGFESAWGIARVNDPAALKNYMESYHIEPVTKAVWTKHVEPKVNITMGYGFSKTSRGKVKDPIYSFGCGAVELTRSQILEFADHRDEYLNAIKKRDELEKKLRAQITQEHEKVNKWLTEHPGANTVLTVLRQRNLRPEKANPERLKRLFG